MLTDYSDLEQEMSEVPEPPTLPIGTEAKLRIIFVGSGEGEYGKWYRVSYDVPSEPLVKEFGDFFSDPLDAKILSDEKQKKKAFRKFYAFATAFGIDISRPFDWEDDLVGLEGWTILGVKKNDEYGEQNTVSKYVVGQVNKRPADHGTDEIPF